MPFRITRYWLLILAAGLAVKTVFIPVQFVGVCVDSLVLAIVIIGLIYSMSAAQWLAAAMAGISIFRVIESGYPAWKLAGPWTIAGALLFLLRAKDRQIAGVLKRVKTQDQVSVREALTFLTERRKQLRVSITEKDELIQEISQLYHLSREFLGTLDPKDALRLTSDALAKLVPSLKEADRTVIVQKIKELVDQDKVSVEAIIQMVPMAGTDLLVRERWGIVAGQLALGLQRASLYRQVQESATHDGLTKLLVRRHFLERLTEEVDRASRRGMALSFLMIDLDHFKRVNDTYGHLVGDVVLKEIAGLIHGSVREMDLVGRYGGEEFAVILPEADPSLAVQIADRIRLMVETSPIRAYDEEIRVTVSVGVSSYPSSASTMEELIEQADQAMYRAKAGGRNKTSVAWEE